MTNVTIHSTVRYTRGKAVIPRGNVAMLDFYIITYSVGESDCSFYVLLTPEEAYALYWLKVTHRFFLRSGKVSVPASITRKVGQYNNNALINFLDLDRVVAGLKVTDNFLEGHFYQHVWDKGLRSLFVGGSHERCAVFDAINKKMEDGALIALCMRTPVEL